jgi:hypothetical protein
MRLLNIFLSIILLCSFLGCSKDEVLVAEYLTNRSSKTWKLKSLYINDANQTLTPAQRIYTKTYKTDFTWVDSDGYNGTFTVDGKTALLEITENATGGPVTINYSITDIQTTYFSIEYTLNQDKYKFVYEQ